MGIKKFNWLAVVTAKLQLFKIKFFLYKKYRYIRRKFERWSKNKFERRILRRWEIFWRDARDLHLIDEKLEAADSMETWTNIENWQRRLENKYNAKQFAIKHGCKVAELYWQGNKKQFSQLDLDSLPENYTIKPIFGESTKNVFLMRKGYNLFNSRFYTPDILRKELNKLFDSIEGLEILIEEFLPNEKREYVVPSDYRFYTYNGKILFIQLDKRRGLEKEQVSFYTPKWDLIRKKILKDATVTVYDPPPLCLEKMITDVKRLSKEYKTFVRIDFYASQGEAVFGEFTATPRKGKDTTQFGSRILIQMWDRHCKGLI